MNHGSREAVYELPCPTHWCWGVTSSSLAGCCGLHQTHLEPALNPFPDRGKSEGLFHGLPLIFISPHDQWSPALGYHPCASVPVSHILQCSHLEPASQLLFPALLYVDKLCDWNVSITAVWEKASRSSVPAWLIAEQRAPLLIHGFLPGLSMSHSAPGGHGSATWMIHCSFAPGRRQ